METDLQYRRSRARSAVMAWDAFHKAHPNAFMIFADLDRRDQQRFTLLGTLIANMGVKGRYALYPESNLIRVAFELAADAASFASLVHARRTTREDGWAEQWELALDDAKASALQSQLPTQPKRLARPGPRAKKRELPL
jgi:hypothetical protein